MVRSLRDLSAVAVPDTVMFAPANVVPADVRERTRVVKHMNMENAIYDGSVEWVQHYVNRGFSDWAQGLLWSIQYGQADIARCFVGGGVTVAFKHVQAAAVRGDDAVVDMLVQNHDTITDSYEASIELPQDDTAWTNTTNSWLLLVVWLGQGGHVELARRYYDRLLRQLGKTEADVTYKFWVQMLTAAVNTGRYDQAVVALSNIDTMSVAKGQELYITAAIYDYPQLLDLMEDYLTEVGQYTPQLVGTTAAMVALEGNYLLAGYLYRHVRESATHILPTLIALGLSLLQAGVVLAKITRHVWNELVRTADIPQDAFESLRWRHRSPRLVDEPSGYIPMALFDHTNVGTVTVPLYQWLRSRGYIPRYGQDEAE